MFTKVMTTRLIELIKERTDELFPSSRKANAAATQFAAWEEITQILNLEYPENVKTLKQVQCKWKNVRQEVKDDVARLRGKYRSDFRTRRRSEDVTGGIFEGNRSHCASSVSPGAVVGSTANLPSEQLTLFLQNVLRTQNSLNGSATNGADIAASVLFNGDSADEGDEKCNENNFTNYNEPGTSSNSPFGAENGGEALSEQQQNNAHSNSKNDNSHGFNHYNKITNKNNINSNSLSAKENFLLGSGARGIAIPFVSGNANTNITKANSGNGERCRFQRQASVPIVQYQQRQQNLYNDNNNSNNYSKTTYPNVMGKDANNLYKRKRGTGFRRNADYLSDEDNEVDYNDDVDSGRSALRRIRLEAETLKCEILREKLASAKKMTNMLDNANQFLCTAVGLMQTFAGKQFNHTMNDERRSGEKTATSKDKCNVMIYENTQNDKESD